MNLLVIDGNSIINRAFYGIKLLTAKDGHFTNAIFGFMNIFNNLVNLTKPECIAVAFDVHAPTFRHKMYSEYKAGRKSMPSELFEQMEPLKEILRAYGCHIIECPGFEADDILGTLAYNCKGENHCYIATGDRDSLQLVSDSVSVLLTTTKTGQTQTVEYTPQRLFEEYGLTPEQMIELKALQGDNSDNLPGVAGIGPKTAGELIKKYKSIDKIYEDVDALEITAGTKNKLLLGRESAYLTRTLGTISKEAPIETKTEFYKLKERDDEKLLAELARHDLFKIIERFGLNKNKAVFSSKKVENTGRFSLSNDYDEFCKSAEQCKELCLSIIFDCKEIAFTAVSFDSCVYLFEKSHFDNVISLISQKKLPVITNQSKEIFGYCTKNAIVSPDIVFDINLAAYLLDVNASDYSVKSVALSYGINPPPIDNIDTYSDELSDFILQTALMPALKSRLAGIIAEREQSKLLTDIEIPLAKVLADMEYCGFAVDKAAIEQYSEVLKLKIDNLQREIYDITQEEFNINSPKQLGTVLFEKLGLPAKKKTKSGYSTNAEVLQELAEEYPIVEKILDFRTYSKLKSTYCDGLLKAIEPDGRIRSTFNQTETRTGRLSSSEPNLQNIPVRTQVGREFRKFFCAKKGFVIVDADYSQIELRVLAALSGDKNMIAAFNSDSDIHTVTASKVFGVPETEVTPELRTKAKAVNFGIVYGIGAFSLSKDIKSSRKEAEEFIKSYLALYTSIDEYMKNNIVSAKKDGYVTTLFSRRRYLPELSSSNGMLRAFGERVARNMPIQGTAADIIKIAMIKVYEKLKAEIPDGKLIMQVHDELILEVPENEAQKAAGILKTEMENAVCLSVKFSADVGIGQNWYEAKS